jgi:ribosome biogenesis GTPase A
LEELSEEIGMLNRKLELEVTKKYQTSRKTIYGVDNELHLVEEIQKALSMIYENTDAEDFRSSIVITLEKLIKQNDPILYDDEN